MRFPQARTHRKLPLEGGHCPSSTGPCPRPAVVPQACLLPDRGSLSHAPQVPVPLTSQLLHVQGGHLSPGVACCPAGRVPEGSPPCSPCLCKAQGLASPPCLSGVDPGLPLRRALPTRAWPCLLPRAGSGLPCPTLQTRPTEPCALDCQNKSQRVPGSGGSLGPCSPRQTHHLALRPLEAGLSLLSGRSQLWAWCPAPPSLSGQDASGDRAAYGHQSDWGHSQTSLKRWAARQPDQARWMAQQDPMQGQPLLGASAHLCLWSTEVPAPASTWAGARQQPAGTAS